MKKVFSISLMMLTLAAMLQLTVTTHYCGGQKAASKISLSGKLASCGMEGDGTSLPCTDTFVKTNCCQDIVHSYSITCNYFPSFSVVPEKNQQISSHFDTPNGTALRSPLSVKTFSDKSPPGVFDFRSVDLSEICILRI
jgi:hypothetical protein